nr:dihydrolipoamide acetyltransferase family protein [Thalassobacillus sp. CUG 92003]
MPQLGESVTEGTISSWLVAPGDQVNKYDPIAEVMTDKVNAEVPSSFTGVIKELIADEGDTIQVGESMCYIEIEGGESSGGAEEASKEDESENKTETTPSEKPASSDSQDQSKPSESKPKKKRYSPAVMTLAQDHDIDLNQVEGSGREGRITRKDLEKIIESGHVPQAKTSSQAPEQEQGQEQEPKRSENPAAPVKVEKGDKEIPVTGVRKAIAQNMVKSTTEIPHAWMMVEVDVTNLVDYRQAMKDKFKADEGYSLTFFSFFVKAVAQTLKAYPELNSTWAGDKIIQRQAINLNIAVASGNELFVPVIKNADEKSIKGIAKDITELAMKARNNKLTSADMEGGTFTVNNTGSFGSVQSMGVINHPQAAILQVESIVKRPVIKDGMFAARDMVNLCLSLDHRVLDGLLAGNFLAALKENLENISKNTTSIY